MAIFVAKVASLREVFRGPSPHRVGQYQLNRRRCLLVIVEVGRDLDRGYQEEGNYNFFQGSNQEGGERGRTIG